MARAAGFTRVEVVPFGLDRTGEQTLRTYLRQVEVDEKLLDEICLALPRHGERYLSKLKPDDLSPSYLFYFANDGSTEDRDWVPRFHFDFERSSKGVRVQGWCMASVPLKWVIVDVAGQAHRLPIWRPRPDVQSIANENAHYPAINALCSGVSEEIESSEAWKPLDIALSAVTTTGVTIPLGRLKQDNRVSAEAIVPSQLLWFIFDRLKNFIQSNLKKPSLACESTFICGKCPLSRSIWAVRRTIRWRNGPASSKPLARFGAMGGALARGRALRPGGRPSNPSSTPFFIFVGRRSRKSLM